MSGPARRGRVVVVGLGPAGPELLTEAAIDAIARTGHRFVRTRRHPAASAVTAATSFDRVYETAGSLDEVYPRIVEELASTAGRHGEICYAVPGSPLVAERTVELLRADERVTVEVVPGLSFLDLAWDRLGVDPLAAGVRLVDGHRFATEAAGERGPLLVAQCDSTATLSDIKLAVEGEPPPSVTVLQRLGLPDEAVTTVAWADLDRSVPADHLTTVFIPTMAAPVAAELTRFAELVRTLRAECPWDREQTHASLTRHLLEVTYDVLDAIEALGTDGEGDDHLEEELGDLLFQVVFHPTVPAERGAFGLADVARGIHDKLVRRHPHVFGSVAVDGADEVVANWDEIKQAEKGRTSAFDGIPAALPALAYAAKVAKKAEQVTGEGDLAATRAELRSAAESTTTDPEAIGHLLYATADLARRLELDPEALLRTTAEAHRRTATAQERSARR